MWPMGQLGLKRGRREEGGPRQMLDWKAGANAAGNGPREKESQPELCASGGTKRIRERARAGAEEERFPLVCGCLSGVLPGSPELAALAGYSNARLNLPDEFRSNHGRLQFGKRLRLIQPHAGAIQRCGEGRLPKQLRILEQPSSEQGLGGLVEPLVQKNPNFASQIRSMVHAAQLEALKRRGRRTREIVPRWIRAFESHGPGLLRFLAGGYIANKCTQCKVLFHLHMGVEATPGNGLCGGIPEQLINAACSGCSGDYEDPDLTAPAAGEGDVENGEQDGPDGENRGETDVAESMGDKPHSRGS